MKAKITLTSRDSAIVEPIPLRETSITRLVFKAKIVHNKRNESRPVEGELIWQRRKPSEQGEEWADESGLSLTSMTAGSGVKLDLNTDELYALTQIVRGLYGVYWQNDRQLPETGDEFELADYAQAAKSLDVLGEAAEIVSTLGVDGFVSLLQILAKQGNAINVLKASERIDFGELAGITSLAGIAMLRQVLLIWESNRHNTNEEFWQNTLSRHSFVFSQLFSTPVVVFQAKAYVGGKDVTGHGGKSPDFLLKNELTSHVLIVEIKTPETPLLGTKPYRGPDVYAMDRELSGSIAQIGKYKDDFLKNYPVLLMESEDKFLAADPRCLIIIGCTDQLETPAMKDSFEYVRRGQQTTEIITFDELFKKVETLLQLLEGEQQYS